MWYDGTKWSSGQFTISSALSIWISNSLGNDNNVGTSSVTPLKTFAEFINRYGISPQVSAVLTITFLDATVAENITFEPQMQNGGQVFFLGTATTVASGTITTVNQQRTPASGLALEVSPAQNWDGYIGTTLLTHDASGGQFWIGKIVTAGTRYRLSSLLTVSPGSSPSPTEIINMANGDSYTLSTITVFTGFVRITSKGALGYTNPMSVWIERCDFRGSGGLSVFNGNGGGR